ncbi:hypothetical protein Tco_0413617, partial [Tanacetum coccineum]
MRTAQHGEAIRSIQERLLEIPTQEELRALRDKVDVAEAGRATLRTTIRSIGAIETSLRNRLRGLQETRGFHDQSVRISPIDMLLHDL